ncbi:methyltransferase domain-containing protein [Streptomyces sp. CT34]|uniref:class I SAM-dependent methyltransferase n=1 Tax=Streptomyces sp. CT34 TaxID=1553907 RepID=UPI000690AA17|nr:methyltransferase domain-containing protein [Streptomyces sp. CT34]
MSRDRDVAAFDRRAVGYEAGRLGQAHRIIVERTADIALAAVPSPCRVLDVGCGTGMLLRSLAYRSPTAACLLGVDPAPKMAAAAARVPGLDRRIGLFVGVAEALPFADGAFDLVVSTTSFDHWADQLRGLGECARVLGPGGRLVLADLFSPIRLPAMWLGRRGRARTVHTATKALNVAGFRSLSWHHPAPLIRAVVATT